MLQCQFMYFYVVVGMFCNVYVHKTYYNLGHKKEHKYLYVCVFVYNIVNVKETMFNTYKHRRLILLSNIFYYTSLLFVFA